MNAIISLCHFCELHGPSVLFCTQAFHDTEEPSVFSTGEKLPPRSYYGPMEIFERALHATLSSSERSRSNQMTAEISDTCEGCTSMKGHQWGFISNDHTARLSYISSHHPLHPEVFSIVRQACVRSLSCEVCPGREGPIYFGDEHRGHVLSYTFFMKDSQARGFQRWYSIVIVMKDKIFLLNSWNFFVKHLQTVISELQEKASKVYETEQSECSQRAIRLNSVTRMTPNNFRRQRGNVKARSIVELTNEKTIFSQIHMWFTWVLHAGANRLTERLLEGFPSEDTVIDLEKQEETEEGFIKLHLKKVSLEDNDKDSDSLPSSESVELDSRVQPKSIQELFHFLGQDKFEVVLHHCILGNQLIVKSKSTLLVKTLFLCLKDILPKGCFHPIFYSSAYIDSWKCNFLGIPPSVTIPSYVTNPRLHLIIDLECSQMVDVDELPELKNVTVNFQSSAELPDKVPQIVSEITRLVQVKFSTATLEAAIAALKEEWLNKAKMLFAFSRSGQRSNEEMSKLLQVLGAQEQDKQVLKFWMTGLSMQYKTHVLTSSMQQGGGSIPGKNG